MRQGLHNEIKLAIFLTLVLFVIGLINNNITLVILIGWTAYAGWTLSRITKFYKWIDDENSDFPPESFGIWGDISDRLYRSQQRNRQAKVIHRSLVRRIGSITSALEEGMVILSRDRSIDWWNPAAARLLKLNDDDGGRAITTLVRNPEFVEFIQQSEFNQALEVPSHIQEGQTLMFSAATFESHNVVLTVSDVTRLRNLEQMRKDFVANISHELRTPLTVLTGYLETLQLDSDAIPKNWQGPLEQMSQQTDRMTALANDLILLSKLESMDIQPSLNPINVKPMLERIAKDAEALSDGNHTLTISCQDDIKIFGEANELYSAISNLVFNAVRHNPQGADIHLKTVEDDEHTSIAIEDNGTGIDSKHLPRLTERFYRVDSSRTSSTGGTGLGLAIVKHVLLRHQAELDIASELGRGTTITCIFNRPESEQQLKHA